MSDIIEIFEKWSSVFDEWFETIQKVHHLVKECNIDDEVYFAVCREKEFCKEHNKHHLQDLSFTKKKDANDEELEDSIYDELWYHIYFEKNFYALCFLCKLADDKELETVKALEFMKKSEDGLEYNFDIIDMTDYYA